MKETHCWCGNLTFVEFSPDYGVCNRCGTLVCTQLHDPGFFQVVDEGDSFYGRDYWFDHQTEELKNPPIIERARNDLSERAIYWLRTILKYCLPPAKCLELGSGHGGLVALLRQVGYEATGLEISPWIVDYSKNTFEIPVLLGPIEEQDLQPSSLDLILMMDVLEHMPDPLSTIEHCMPLLKPDGKFIIQTPEYQTGRKYQDFQQEGDPFLKMLLPGEHVNIFTRDSITTFFQRVGMRNLVFEKAFFPYDMFLVASRGTVQASSSEKVDEFLLKSPGGRIGLALLDLNEYKLKLEIQLAESESDRKARLQVINRLDKRVREIDADREAKFEIIQKLEEQLHESESDREARLNSIHKLESLLRESEDDRAMRLDIIKELESRLEESEADREARLKSMHELETLLRESEEDRGKRLNVINELENKLEESEADRDARLVVIQELEHRLQEVEDDRRARLEVIHDLNRLLKESEADRASRLEVIRSQHNIINELESERDNYIESLAQKSELIKNQLSQLESLEKELSWSPIRFFRSLRNLWQNINIRG